MVFIFVPSLCVKYSYANKGFVEYGLYSFSVRPATRKRQADAFKNVHRFKEFALSAWNPVQTNTTF